MQKIKKMQITILALENSLASTIIGPMDIFSLAGILWNQLRGLGPTPYFDVKTVSLDGKKIRCHNNLQIEPHGSIHQAGHSDLIIIPAVGIESLYTHSKKLLVWLQTQFAQGASIASICSGAFVLAETGLLNGKNATTHWGYAEIFRKRYPEVILKRECLVTDEGNLFCAGGLHSYYDLSLYLIEKYCSFEIATQCAKAFLLDLQRSSQNFYTVFDFQKKHGDTEVLKAQTWLENHFSKKVSLEEIASVVHMGLRNFKRRFKQATGDSPTLYLQRLRIEKAKRALENPRNSIENISGAVGYADANFFRQIFKKHVGLSPRAYRKKFKNS